MNHIALLIADDDRETRRLLEQSFYNMNYQIFGAANGKEAWEFILGYERPLCTLLDWGMPEMTGIEVVGKIKELCIERPDRFVYPALITGKFISPDEIAAGIISGARAVLTKPIQFTELFAHVCAAEEAYKMALTRQDVLRRDDLTGFYNQTQGLERLKEEVSRAERSGNGLAFVFIDMDKFKSINDEYGHPVGSEVLHMAAKRIEESKRPYDVAIRYGGDEFALIFPDITEDGAKDKAERIWNRISKHPFRIASQSIPVTVSVGVAVRRVDDHVSSNDLVRMADEALYEAKRKGRNRVQLYGQVNE